MSIGIDYGMGIANVDHETGIRYGVISEGSLDDWVSAEAEPVYDQFCPHCEHVFGEDDQPGEGEEHEYLCPHCDKEFDNDDSWGEDAIDWEYDLGEGVKAEHTSLGIYVVSSPYVMRCAFCSPCAPGAGDLDAPRKNGIWAYAPAPVALPEESELRQWIRPLAEAIDKVGDNASK